MDKVVVSQDKTQITVYMVNGPNLTFKLVSGSMLVTRIGWVLCEISKMINVKAS